MVLSICFVVLLKRTFARACIALFAALAAITSRVDKSVTSAQIVARFDHEVINFLCFDLEFVWAFEW